MEELSSINIYYPHQKLEFDNHFCLSFPYQNPTCFRIFTETFFSVNSFWAARYCLIDWRLDFKIIIALLFLRFERRPLRDSRYLNFFSSIVSRAPRFSCLLDSVSRQRDMPSTKSQNCWRHNLCVECENALASSSGRKFLSICVLCFFIGSIVCGVTGVTCSGKSSSICRFCGCSWLQV